MTLISTSRLTFGFCRADSVQQQKKKKKQNETYEDIDVFRKGTKWC